MYAKYIGTSGISVKEYLVKSDKIPKSLSGSKIIYFSDLLLGSTTNLDTLKLIAKRINELNPDIVIFGGNLLSDLKYLDNKSDLVSELKNICAYANYNGYDYCATAEQIENNCIYVVNPAGIEQLKNNYKGNKKIYTIYISCRLADRYNRMTARGNTYDEALKRVINDADEFNGYKNNCDFVVRNDNYDDFSNVIDMIAEFINEKENE